MRRGFGGGGENLAPDRFSGGNDRPRKRRQVTSQSHDTSSCTRAVVMRADSRTTTCDGRYKAMPSRQGDIRLPGVQPVLPRQGETPLRGVHPLPPRQAETQVRRVQPMPARQAVRQLRGVHPLSARQAETELCGVQTLPPRSAERQLRGVQPLSARQAEILLRCVQPLPSRQVETKLRGVQNSTRGSAEVEAGQALAVKFARGQARARDQTRARDQAGARDQTRAVHDPRLLWVRRGRGVGVGRCSVCVGVFITTFPGRITSLFSVNQYHAYPSVP